jgi:hypothetical protein
MYPVFLMAILPSAYTYLSNPYSIPRFALKKGHIQRMRLTFHTFIYLGIRIRRRRLALGRLVRSSPLGPERPA